MLRYIVPYLPFSLAWLVQDTPVLSYWIAWSGSWVILWLSLSGRLVALPEDKPWYQQLLRPLFLPQIIFVGYMALTSIFYFLYLNGFLFNAGSSQLNLEREIWLSAAAQRYYALAHAALVHGMIWRMRYQKPAFKFSEQNQLNTLLLITIIFLILGYVLGAVSALSQFSVKFESLSFVSVTLLLVLALSARRYSTIVIVGTLFLYDLYTAVLSGWKEAVLLPLILLSAYLFPKYKRVFYALSLPGAIFVFFLLPKYAETFRKLSWTGGVHAEEAAKIAYNAVINADLADLQESNEGFLTARVSEISMFNKYLKKIPEQREFYEWEIIRQGLYNLIPRFLYLDKPDTEKLVMQRVYENGIVETYSTNVSAKPQLAIDGYLSFGALGVWLFCFVLGLTSAFASVQAERLFGGYTWGTCLIYTGLFQEFWRGNCFEFLLNTAFWSLVSMYILFYLGKQFRFLERVEQ